MLIKRVKFSDLYDFNQSVVVIGRIRFYDENGSKINIGKMISNVSNMQFETENAYIFSNLERYSELSYDAFNDGYYSMKGSNDARKNIQIIFKEPVTISKFEFDTGTKYPTNSNINVEFYNVNNELINTYIVKQNEYEFFNKNSLRLITIPTPELADIKKHFTFSEKKANGATKNYTLEKKEVSAIPLFFNSEFDSEISKVDASKEKAIDKKIEHVFKNNPVEDYKFAYQSVDTSNMQLVHPSIKIEFKKPRLINAVEIQSMMRKNVNIIFEGYDEINKEWNLLSEYKAPVINQFGKIRMQFDNSRRYFLYKITFMNLDDVVLINDIKLYEYQSFLKEISISSPEDYKEYGMRSGEYYWTSNVLRKVVQNIKTKYSTGNVFSKLFDNKNKEIKSITI
ncbi:hypothetical protein [Paenibacillus alvei]|uniref:hypothetical protein n=1 Tax=Paenibacillus alvei TaxID=44250 RepID=UPI000386321F|nr:hypothetical protein [Paenibacillus alvei]EPY09412.1 hypothetical protein PAAL66ix_28470 [Paenibacillus alvei A6-6i-x]